MADVRLSELLSAYANHTDNAQLTFELGNAYFKLGQTASATTYYHKAAELSEHSNLEMCYSSLILMGRCFEIQGRRDISVKSCYLHALSVCPDRPEAYFFLSQLYERVQKYPDAYTYARLGLNVLEGKVYEKNVVLGYPGKYGLAYQQAVTGWSWGKTEEAIEIFREIIQRRDYLQITEEYASAINKNLLRIDPTWKESIVATGPDDEFTVVVQGPADVHHTKMIAEKYASYPFVTTVIVSCWNTCPHIAYESSKIKVYRSEDPTEPGTGNRNRQIISSREGLKHVTTGVAMKVRSDLLFSEKTMKTYLDFFLKRRAAGKDQIMSFGIFDNLLFHPCDHMFLGTTDSLRELFSAPLEYNGFSHRIPIPQMQLWKYYDQFIRTETYLGIHYCAKKLPDLYARLVYPDRYLHDGSLHWDQTYAESREIFPKYFKALPKPIEDVIWYNELPTGQAYPLNNLPTLRWDEDGV